MTWKPKQSYFLQSTRLFVVFFSKISHKEKKRKEKKSMILIRLELMKEVFIRKRRTQAELRRRAGYRLETVADETVRLGKKMKTDLKLQIFLIMQEVCALAL